MRLGPRQYERFFPALIGRKVKTVHENQIEVVEYWGDRAFDWLAGSRITPLLQHSIAALSPPQRNRSFAFSRKLLVCGFTLASHSSANSCSLARCAAFKCAGTSTCTRTCRSPDP